MTLGSAFPWTGHFFCLLGGSLSGGGFRTPGANTTLLSLWWHKTELNDERLAFIGFSFINRIYIYKIHRAVMSTMVLYKVILDFMTLAKITCKKTLLQVPYIDEETYTNNFSLVE